VEHVAVVHTGMRASMSLEIESVVEAFAARRTEISLDVAVTLDVTVQQTLQWKRFATYAASEFVLSSLDAYRNISPMQYFHFSLVTQLRKSVIVSC